MTTAYTDIIDVWTSDRLKKQILFAVMKTASYILTAEAGDAPNHAARLNWAKIVVIDPYEAAMKISVGVISNGDIQAGNPTDVTVQYVVDTMIDVFVPACKVRDDLTWAEWLAVALVVVFVFLPVTVWRMGQAAWLRWTGQWVREERAHTYEDL